MRIVLQVRKHQEQQQQQQQQKQAADQGGEEADAGGLKSAARESPPSSPTPASPGPAALGEKRDLAADVGERKKAARAVSASSPSLSGAAAGAFVQGAVTSDSHFSTGALVDKKPKASSKKRERNGPRPESPVARPAAAAVGLVLEGASSASLHAAASAAAAVAVAVDEVSSEESLLPREALAGARPLSATSVVCKKRKTQPQTNPGVDKGKLEASSNHSSGVVGVLVGLDGCGGGENKAKFRGQQSALAAVAAATDRGGRDRKVGASVEDRGESSVVATRLLSSLFHPCSSRHSRQPSPPPPRKMGGGENYRGRRACIVGEGIGDGNGNGERDERVDCRQGGGHPSSAAALPPDREDVDPAVEERVSEVGIGVDFIQYGARLEGEDVEEVDENDDPAIVANSGGERIRQQVASALPSSMLSSSSASASARRRRPGSVGKGDGFCTTIPTSAYASAAAVSTVTGETAPLPSHVDFEAALKGRGLEMVEVEGDGNCLFRAVSLQVYGDANNHGEVRRRCLDFMSRDEPHFSQFITDEPFWEYVRRKREDGVHGNNPEIQAISELFNRPVEVFVPENGAKPINIFHAEYKTSDAPIRLSYHDGNHYNAVVDPILPTAGLGLGLPGLEPGLADRLQLEKAKEESEMELAAEESHRVEMDRALEESRTSVERAYDKQKALVMSDLEATDYELERAVLESSLESYRRNEMGRKASASSSSSSSSSSHHHHYHRGRRGAGSLSPPGFRTQEEPAASRAEALLSSTYASAAAATAAAAPAPPAVAASAHGGSEDRDEYPPTVQELVMNGFELDKVLRAYDLVGDNFDALLSVLMSNVT